MGSNGSRGHTWDPMRVGWRHMGSNGVKGAYMGSKWGRVKETHGIEWVEGDTWDQM